MYPVWIMLSFFNIEPSLAIYKRWTSDTNWENSENWNVKRSPCGNDRVLIPDDSPLIYFQTNSTLRELTLPKDGEIVFGNNAQLVFTDMLASDCVDVDGDVEFSAINAKRWTNPDNWCTVDTEHGDCLHASPVDTENVPCANDDVVFLREHSYYLTLGENLHLTVNSLKMSATIFTTDSFSQFYNSIDGSKIFDMSPSSQGTSLIITHQKCDDIGGCACGNDVNEIMKSICAIKSKRCGRSPCTFPVQPTGACCDMCGVVITGTQGRGFNYESFKTKLQPFFDLFPNVTTAVSITGTGQVQVVLKDSSTGTGIDSKTLAKVIDDDIRKDLGSGGHTYALDSFTSTMDSDISGPSARIGGVAHNAISTAVWWIVGIILVVIIFLLIVIAWRRKRPTLPRILRRRNWPDLNVTFTRFRNVDENSAPSHDSSETRIIGPLEMNSGFSNPVYQPQTYDMGNEMVLRNPMEGRPTFEIEDPITGFNNPLYETPTHFIDPSETSDEYKIIPNASE